MNGDIKLNQWYKCLVYKNDCKYINFTKIDNYFYSGKWIHHSNFFKEGTWKVNDIIKIDETNFPTIVYELFDSEDSSNIIIALEILKQNL